MVQRYKLLAVSGAVLSVIFAALPSGSASASTAATCTTHASTPTYSSGTVYVTGTVSCDRVVTSLSVRAAIWRDGTVEAGDNYKECSYSSSCGVTASAPNRAGNQEWCNYTQGWSGTLFVGSEEVCENQNW